MRTILLNPSKLSCGEAQGSAALPRKGHVADSSDGHQKPRTSALLVQAPVVQTFDSATHLINHYPADKYCGNQLHYPLDRDLSDG